jgi:hypothetical protein
MAGSLREWHECALPGFHRSVNDLNYRPVHQISRLRLFDGDEPFVTAPPCKRRWAVCVLLLSCSYRVHPRKTFNGLYPHLFVFIIDAFMVKILTISMQIDAKGKICRQPTTVL